MSKKALKDLGCRRRRDRLLFSTFREVGAEHDQNANHLLNSPRSSTSDEIDISRIKEQPEIEIDLPQVEIDQPEVEIHQSEVEIDQPEVEIGQAEVRINQPEIEEAHSEDEIDNAEVEIQHFHYQDAAMNMEVNFPREILSSSTSSDESADSESINLIEERDTDNEYISSESEDEFADILPNNDEEALDQPLYRGATINVMQSMLLILTLLLHHNVTMTCLSDIITVINFHCLSENLQRNSLYKFRKYFSIDGKVDLKKHYYCATCIRQLKTNDDICPSCPKRPNCYFVTLPFINQLREMYKRNNFNNTLQHRFHRAVYPQGVLTDIYDGTLYQSWMANGFLANSNNISFSWYTDGVPVFQSSKISMWPFYLTINELPFENRKKRENTLLAGLWYGSTSPDMNRFIYSLRLDLEKLLIDGIDVRIPNNNSQINVKAILLTGTCDCPARSKCLNFISFNGNYGCSYCFCKGESIPLETGGHVHAYPYMSQLYLRTAENIQQLVQNATTDSPIMGVLGPSAFSRLMPDFIQGMGLDRMHCVDGGVIKKLLNLWLGVENRAKPFSLYNVVDVINSRLTSIKPPKFVHRMPRTVVDLIHWKASELRMWFFSYSVPVLEGVMRPDYFQHYLLLLTAIAILSSDLITPEMIRISRDFLHKFVREFELLYGVRYCSINIHQLLHFSDIVETLGPLWVYTCFEYENLNGKFLNLIHGTNHIDTQIARAQNQLISMAKYIEKLPEGEIKDFCTKTKKQVKIIDKLEEHCYSVGSYKRIWQLFGMVRNAMQNFGFSRNFQVWQFSRLLKNGKLYVSEIYKENKLQTYSCVVQYTDNNILQFGIIYCFLKILNCNCQVEQCECAHEYFAIVKHLVYQEAFHVQGDHCHYSSDKFLKNCDITNHISYIPVSNLITVCTFMKIEQKMYIAVPINQKEIE